MLTHPNFKILIILLIQVKQWAILKSTAPLTKSNHYSTKPSHKCNNINATVTTSKQKTSVSPLNNLERISKLEESMKWNKDMDKNKVTWTKLIRTNLDPLMECGMQRLLSMLIKEKNLLMIWKRDIRLSLKLKGMISKSNYLTKLKRAHNT